MRAKYLLIFFCFLVYFNNLFYFLSDSQDKLMSKSNKCLVINKNEIKKVQMRIDREKNFLARHRAYAFINVFFLLWIIFSESNGGFIIIII